jgi:geranylgeranyl diphosphate synthase type II
MTSIKEISSLYADTFSSKDFNQEPVGLYEPMNHILSIPGKRIRPLLLLLSTQAFGGEPLSALDPAHAMELFHNFTLVHDDIMDDATLRRGIITVHEKYGPNAGVLSGDALFAYSYKYLSQVPLQSMPDVFSIFTKAAIEILEGQQMDMDFEKRMDVSIPEYLHMIEYKTSVLLACSLRIGAVISGAEVADQERIYDFGVKLGLSFQIKDDWLDTFGESDKVGKKKGGDIIQNKKTFLLITLINDISDQDRVALDDMLHEKDEDKKIAGIKALYAKYDISEKTLKKAESLYTESLAALASVQIAEAQKANLYAMAELIKNRDF